MSPSPFVPPRLVVTMGVYRSASTWAANVVAEILRPRGPTEIIVADSAAEIARKIGTGAATYVVKTHRPDASMRCLVRVADLPVILTVRDPADCVASLIDQFEERFESARASVALSCEAILWMVPFCRPSTLRYEDPCARDAAAVAGLAAHLGVAITDEKARTIAEGLAPDEVRRLIDHFAASGVFGRSPRPHHVHAATQWHPRHVGPGHVGRHQTILTPAQAAEVRLLTRPFRDYFIYPAPATEIAPPMHGEDRAALLPA